ncbi:MAG: BNR-4 repeat-containing protein [Thalassotalea sp.]
MKDKLLSALLSTLARNIVFTTVASVSALLSINVLAAPIVLNDNGAWCWFQDERAIVSNNKLLFGTVASEGGVSGVARKGNIEVTTYDLSGSSAPVVNVMHHGLQDDDHNVPALITLPDKTVMAIYSQHNADRQVRYRITKDAEALTEWLPEVSMSRKDKITYANLMYLSEENNGKGRLYNFYRGIEFNPTFDTSDDQGQTWSKGSHFIKNEGRPYVKYIGNNRDEIHFTTTEQHPRNFDNSIYHGYIKAGNVYKSDGSLIQALADGPIKPTDLTLVYQGGPDNVAWTVDMHLDEDGQVYTVFSVQMNDGDKARNIKSYAERDKGPVHGEDMRYYYAKLLQPSWWQFWQAPQWQVNEVSYAGTRLYQREQDYTGLVALNPQNPNEMVVSTNAHPVTGKPLISKADGKRHWELFKGVSNDNGLSWHWVYLTKDSQVDNLRPIIPINHESDDLHLLWMQGEYISFLETNTKIMLATNPQPVAQ